MSSSYTLKIFNDQLELDYTGSSGNPIYKYSTNELTAYAIKSVLQDITSHFHEEIRLEYHCDRVTEILFKTTMRQLFLYDNDGSLDEIGKQSEVYKAILQKELNDLGYLTIMRDNEIIVVDKV